MGGERRRALLRGDHDGRERVPGQFSPGADPSRPHQRRHDDRAEGAGRVIWGALVGGLVGTLVLTTALRAASELGLTRIDLPFLLGTALSEDRVRAKAFGYLAHFIFGPLFALVYLAVFTVIDQ